ncbi:MAG: hypothetical protein QXD11_01220 [Candidatus Micrarchaeaceae archaeon]
MKTQNKFLLQTSIEFLLISAAIISTCIFSLGLYSVFQANVISNYKTINFSANYSLSTGSMIIPHVSIYASKIMKEFDTSSVYAIITADGPIQSVELEAQNATVSKPFTDINGTNPYILHFSVIPHSKGNISLTAIAIINGKYYNATFQTFVISNQNMSIENQQNISAVILRNLEEIYYSAAGYTAINKVYITSSCTKLNFFYQPYSLKEQCGNNVAWGVRVTALWCVPGTDSTMTYCFYLQKTNISISNINESYNKIYNITVSIKDGNKLFNSTLTSQEGQGQVFYNGKAIGNATIGNNVTAYGTNLPEQYLFFNRSGNISIANISFYQNYMQYWNNMKGLLGYYNSSYVDSSTFSSIIQSVSVYNNYISKEPYLINKTQDCIVDKDAFTCIPYSPFMYRILIKLKGMNYNNSIYTAGSIIRITD